MEGRRRDYAALCRALPTLDDLFALRRQKLDEVSGRLGRSLGSEVAKKRAAYAGVGVRLSHALLTRGIVRSRERLGMMATRIAQDRSGRLRAWRRDLGRLAARHDIASVRRIVAGQRQRFEDLSRLLRSYSYEAVLDRGFALVVGPAGDAIRSPAQVSLGDLLAIRLATGEIGATVTGPGKPKSRRSLPRRGPDPNQGRLF
jgi:exodeoxyribonuclease VII large subunit